jgi:hypothetical protein
MFFGKIPQQFGLPPLSGKIVKNIPAIQGERIKIILSSSLVQAI